MKFKTGKPPVNENINVSEWNLLKEPKNLIVTQVIALPIGLICAGLIFFILHYFRGIYIPKFGIEYILAYFLMIPIHEMIHALCYPGGLNSKDTVIGYWAEVSVFYAYNSCILKRNRYLLVYIAPFAVLSIIPTIVMLFLDFKSDLLLLIVLFNALSSCVDIFNCILILLQVPKEGLVVNSEEKTYWKLGNYLNART